MNLLRRIEAWLERDSTHHDRDTEARPREPLTLRRPLPPETSANSPATLVPPTMHHLDPMKTEPSPNEAGPLNHREPVSEPPTDREPVSSAKVQKTDPSRNRILLVDDDPAVRDSIAAVLASEGYEVIAAENGLQALDLVDRESVNLVLLDLNMPGKNGWDTFERLTSNHPLIPVIIVTARPNQLLMAVNAGAGALLEKPMDIPVLLRTIQSLLAETEYQRLARLTGRDAQFHYKPGKASRLESVGNAILRLLGDETKPETPGIDALAVPHPRTSRDGSARG